MIEKEQKMIFDGFLLEFWFIRHILYKITLHFIFHKNYYVQLLLSITYNFNNIQAPCNHQVFNNGFSRAYIYDINQWFWVK